MEACVIVLRVMRHNTNSRSYPNKKQHLRVCNDTHTHVTLAGSQLIVSLAGQAEKGEVTWPLMTTYGARSQIDEFELSFFQRQIKISTARFTPNAIFSYWGTIGRLGELILMLENLIK